MRRALLCLAIAAAGMALVMVWSTTGPWASASSSLTATNATGQPASRLVGGMFQNEVSGIATLDVNAPGCAAPVFISTSTFVTTLPPFQGNPTGLDIYIVDFDVRWPSSCVDPGESVVIGFPGSTSTGPLLGVTLSYNFSNTPAPTPTNTPASTPTPTSTPESTAFSMAIDCDVNAAGVQSACNVPLGSASTLVDVVLINNGPATELAAFNFSVNHTDPSRLIAPQPLCTVPRLDCNPDIDQASIGSIGWNCNPILADRFANPGDQSLVSCFNNVAPLAVPPGVVVHVATLTYAIPPGASPGTTVVDLTDVNVYDESASELMSCPLVVIPGTCLDAAIAFFEPPPGSTPTFTSTPAVPTPTTVVPTPALPVSSLELNATPAGPYLAVDCDPHATGIQDQCVYTTGAGLLDVDVVFINNRPIGSRLCCFNFSLLMPDTSRLLAPSLPSGVNSNPDLNEAVFSSVLSCNPMEADSGDAGPGANLSRISCFSGAGFGPVLGAGQAVSLARVHYLAQAGAQPGSVELTFKDVNIFEDFAVEIASCAPAINAPATCLPATITLIDPPPSVHKVPEGNAANADASVPKANLWLCEAPAPCAGAGEGSLRVVERAENVKSDYDADGVPDATDAQICTNFGPDGDPNTPDDSQCPVPGPLELGLGAYEFTVEYDHFVIASVNPCDLVFGPGGAGSSRGPVEELASSANPDCDVAPSPTGSCAMSIILENLVHFGCVTNGQAPGPTGDFDLASLKLVPHVDLSNELFPGNNNGVLTVVKDNGCELVDVFGHPVSGSVSGGLTPTCGDLAVTVRILEGDLDLDCDVDVTDAQMIAARYGAFFGGLLYSKWLDLEPELHDLDIDIKDIQKVFGRDGSSCQAPIPAQPPLDPPAPFGS